MKSSIQNIHRQPLISEAISIDIQMIICFSEDTYIFAKNNVGSAKCCKFFQNICQLNCRVRHVIPVIFLCTAKNPTVSSNVWKALLSVSRMVFSADDATEAEVYMPLKIRWCPFQEAATALQHLCETNCSLFGRYTHLRILVPLKLVNIFFTKIGPHLRPAVNRRPGFRQENS